VGLEPDHVEILAATRRWLRYRLPRRFIRYNQHPVCIGQKQIWFMLRLTADETCLKVDRTDTPEFDEWCWLDYWEPIDRIVPFKRNVYRRALDELARCVVRGNAVTLPGPPWQVVEDAHQRG
jgi:putative (di)nucleoside polyphosphate hydrolase